MKYRLLLGGLFVTLALSPGLAAAAEAAAKAEAQASAADLAQARAELERARAELQRAAEELARVSAEEAGRESPRAKAFQFLTDARRAVLGIGIAPGPEKNGQLRGVLVTAVTPGSGADQAGIKTGDLLLSANGKPLSAKPGVRPSPEHLLREVMTGLEPGAKVQLEYEREGKRSQVSVTAGRAPDSYFSGGPESYWHWSDDEDHDVLMPVPPVPPMPPVPAMPMLYGLRVFDSDFQLAQLDTDLAGYFKTSEGVLVVRAPREGGLGLKSGDVIQRVDGEKVGSPVEVMEHMESADAGRKLSLEIVRQGKKQTVSATLPERREFGLRRRPAPAAAPAPAALPAPAPVAAPAPPAPPRGGHGS